MNSNSCGNGLAVFSFTLILGLLFVGLFVQRDVDFVETISPNAELSIPIGKEKDIKCIREYDVLKLKESCFFRQNDNRDRIELIKKRAELEAKIENRKALYQKTSNLESVLLKLEINVIAEQIEEISREIAELEELEQLRKNSFEGEIRNENLLYSEKCYGIEF